MKTKSTMNTVSISWEEFKNIRPSRARKTINSVSRFFNKLKPARLFNKFIKYPYQRLTRGFSDQDAWNGDSYLAGQIAGLLRWHIKNSHGVGHPYANRESTVDEAAYFRDLDYEKYAKMFDELSNNGIALNKKWQKDFGGLTEKQYKDTMKWFANIYQGLWD